MLCPQTGHKQRGETFFFTVIICKRKNILCYEANVAPIVRLSAHDEVPCGRPMPAPYLIRGRGTNHPRYRFWLARTRHVARKHPLRIRAFVLLPVHTCLRAARRQVPGIWTFDVKIGHEWFDLLGFALLNPTYKTSAFWFSWICPYGVRWLRNMALKKQKNFWSSAKQTLNNAAFIGFWIRDGVTGQCARHIPQYSMMDGDR